MTSCYFNLGDANGKNCMCGLWLCADNKIDANIHLRVRLCHLASLISIVRVHWMSSPSETLRERSRAHYLRAHTDTKWRRREMIRLRKAPRQLNSQSVSPSSARSHQTRSLGNSNSMSSHTHSVSNYEARARGERITRPTLITMCHKKEHLDDDNHLL